MTTGDVRPPAADEPTPSAESPEPAATTPEPAATTPEPSWTAPQPQAPYSWATIPDRDPELELTGPVEIMTVQPKRRSWAVVGTAAGAALALLVGGVVYAAGQLLSGGGTQPEELVPASAFAFAKIDLDPDAGQKLAFRQFAEHFPDAASVLGEHDDLRELIFADIAADAGLDYTDDVEPWLGYRFAVAALPGPAGSEPDVAIYVQVTDEDQAAKVLPQLLASEARPGVVFRKGYGIVSPTQESLDRVVAASGGEALGSDAEFRADMSDLGGDEVAAAWVDLRGFLDAAMGSVPGGLGVLPPDQQAAVDTFSGRIAITARFAGDYAEVFGRVSGSELTTGIDPGATPVGSLMRNLPPDTGAAIAFSGIASSLEQGWSDLTSALAGGGAEGAEVDAMLADLEDRYGLRLPDDLATLLGDQTLIALDLGGLQSEVPQGIGMRSVTDAAAAEKVVEKIISLLEFEFGIDAGSVPLHWTAAGDSFYLTSDPGYTEALQQGGGVADPVFETALPDLDTAQFAVWVDADGLVAAAMPYFDQELADDVVSHLAGVGLTVGYEEGGAATFRLRVVAD